MLSFIEDIFILRIIEITKETKIRGVITRAKVGTSTSEKTHKSVNIESKLLTEPRKKKIGPETNIHNKNILVKI